MKLSDIDFSAISRMMDSMSDEEKEKLNDYANNMMNNMKEKMEPETEEEVDFYSFLGINEEEYGDLPGIVLDQLEAACDMEQYYEDVKESDFSASALFYGKATLNMLRKYIQPIFKNFFDGFTNASTTTIYSYLYLLMNQENIHLLVDEGFGDSMNWIDIKNVLQQVYLMVQRAEYDFISYEDLCSLKQVLIQDKGLLKIKI